MEIPRILISGTSSRAGKTVVSIGLMRALYNRGYKVQPFKVGPDFIDPSYHYFATGVYSRNLDSFMMSGKDIMRTFVRNAKKADISIIEGTMGLYDSHDAIDEKGSTAQVSKIIKAPVILTANIERISRTAAPLVLGYKLFDKNVRIAGVILNRAGNPRHALKARKAVEVLAKMKVFGVLPRDKKVFIPERHLGLVPAHERERIDELFDELAKFIEKNVDVEAIIDTAYKAGELPDFEEDEIFRDKRSNIKIGVVKDRAFTFYYADNIEVLSKRGKIVYIDATKDKSLKNVDALYIGGGFPEVFAEELEKNSKLREEIYEFCESNKPCYAECGGLMYLSESIEINKEEYEMVGLLPLKTVMKKKFQALGYVVHEVVRDNIISRKGDKIIGHEFHYSEPILKKKVDFAYKTIRGKGIDGKHDGIIYKNTLASYAHVHVLSHKKMFDNFIEAAMRAKNT